MRAHAARGVRVVLRAVECVVMGMVCGVTGWDHGGDETDRSWIDRSRDG